MARNHHAPLCVAPGCRARGQHANDCPGGDCRGCLPRRAADGLRLCWQHARHLETDARQLAPLYDELALALAGISSPICRVSGSPDRSSRIPNPAAIEVRGTIRAVLAAWCRLIAEGRGVELPRDEVADMSEYVARHAHWLAAHPAAGDASAELRELAVRAHRIAYPDGTRVVAVGPCPRDGCDGTIRAVLRASDSLLPSRIVCDANADHVWPADQWLTLGRQLRRARERRAPWAIQ